MSEGKYRFGLKEAILSLAMLFVLYLTVSSLILRKEVISGIEAIRNGEGPGTTARTPSGTGAGAAGQNDDGIPVR